MEKREKQLIGYFSLLMILDYVTTYIGIHKYGFIEEANPLMVWLFELPFIPAFSVRCGMVLMIFVLYRYLCIQKHPIRILLIRSGLMINSVVVLIHVYWITHFVLTLAVI